MKETNSLIYPGGEMVTTEDAGGPDDVDEQNFGEANVPPGGSTLNWQQIGDRMTRSVENGRVVERPMVEQKLGRY